MTMILNKANFEKVPENFRREQNPGHIGKFSPPLPRNFWRIRAGDKILGI